MILNIDYLTTFFGCAGPPHYRGFMMTLLYTPHSVRILWTSDQPDAEATTWRHTTLTRDRYPCPRRDSNPQHSKWAVAHPRLRPGGLRDRHSASYIQSNSISEDLEWRDWGL